MSVLVPLKVLKEQSDPTRELTDKQNKCKITHNESQRRARRKINKRRVSVNTPTLWQWRDCTTPSSSPAERAHNARQVRALTLEQRRNCTAPFSFPKKRAHTAREVRALTLERRRDCTASSSSPEKCAHTGREVKALTPERRKHETNAHNNVVSLHPPPVNSGAGLGKTRDQKALNSAFTISCEVRL
ncbi:hypothetical protein NDU88_003473 [Pleurodeles waltl]|uniref:Uncharacterized protein n=1 Tax=Pleurodeles waltl TaxID=8319 RepID=A0AAV7QFR9_PLEWA|nr:hypothetical protein NDU88_003473 [Pleurodeles waltl]